MPSVNNLDMMENQKTRQVWEEVNMSNAIKDVKDGKMGWKLAAKTYDVPATTLRRRCKSKLGSTKGNLGGCQPTFIKEVEEQLVSHIKKLEERFYGLTTADLRTLAFEIAEINNINHRFNKEHKKAGWAWLRSFLRRNPSISLRTPENTSLARAQAFNKVNIGNYFKALTSVLDSHKFSPENNIFNMDESGLSTVQKKPSKILATKGRKQVGTVSSAERGQHVTAVCAMNAVGTYIPPAFIFARKNFKNELLDHAPPGSVGFCQENGWMSGEVFVRWLKHFIHYAKPSEDNPVLLLLDGHTSHKHLNVLELAKENNIILFCFPAHCTHRVQPLDVGFFGPLQVYYDQAIQQWLRANPGRAVTQYQIAGLFSDAYLKAATIGNAVQAFKKTGINPLNANIFDDWLFAPSETTEKPTDNMNNTKNCKNGSSETQTSADKTPCREDLATGESSSSGLATAESSSSGSNIKEGLSISIEELSPIPVARAASSSNRKGRKRGKCGIVNTTPDIKEAKKQEEQKAIQQRAKLSRQAKRKITALDEEGEETQFQNNDDESDDVACLYCNGLYLESRKMDFWIRCDNCLSWCHVDCAGVDCRIKQFTSELCN